jgi:ABC-2 type transport system permease protein
VTKTDDRTSSAPGATSTVGETDLAAARARRLATEPLLAAGPTPGLFAGTARAFTDLWAYRELLVLLVRRELKARYKDSTLGFLWSLLRPLSLLLVYYVAIGKFLGAEREIPEFAVFVFTGLTAWTFYSEVISAGTGSIVGNGALIKKVYLPREIFPLAVVGSALFNMVMQLGVLVAAVPLAGSFPTGSRWLYFPMAILVLAVWGTAFAFVLSAVNVYLRDVQYLVEIGLMVLFWSSPIVYSWELVKKTLDPWVLDVYLLNPVTLAVLGMQKCFWVAGSDRPFPDDLMLRMTGSLGVGLVLLWAGQRLFSRLEANFAQEI